jgi:hypothetical protein
MIAKAFLLTKEIRAMRTKSLRDNKFIRDHAATPPDHELRLVRLRLPVLWVTVLWVTVLWVRRAHWA